MSSSSSSSSAMVDCRSLIEFCRAFEQHHRSNRRPSSSSSSSPAIRSSRRSSKSLNPLSHPFCDHSPSSFALLDALLLLLVLAALSVLSLPSLRALLRHLPSLLHLLSEALRHAPLAYFVALALALAPLLAAYELLGHHLRKCANPCCRGLRKAVDFDIQLESEDCVRYLPPAPMPAFGGPRPPLGLRGDHREELEAELRKMAPPGGRTVLIFRSPCGCPAGRMEVWGAKKVRRIKK